MVESVQNSIGRVSLNASKPDTRMGKDVLKLPADVSNSASGSAGGDTLENFALNMTNVIKLEKTIEVLAAPSEIATEPFRKLAQIQSIFFIM